MEMPEHEGFRTFKATFREVTPFTISVDQEFRNQTTLKVLLTRFVDTELQDQDPWTDGPPSNAAKEVEEWEKEYDSRIVEIELN